MHVQKMLDYLEHLNPQKIEVDPFFWFGNSLLFGLFCLLKLLLFLLEFLPTSKFTFYENIRVQKLSLTFLTI